MAFPSSVWRLTVATAFVATVTAGCRDRAASAAVAETSVTSERPDSATIRPPGYVVDSAMSPDESLRRFREGVPPVRALHPGSATSRDELMRRFAEALSRRDTTALRALTLTRAEFAYLYFPETLYTRPPYVVAPDVLWMLTQQRSERGLRRLAARLGGGEMRFVSHACEPTPTQEGANRLFQRCTVRYRRAGADSIETRRLFGSIIERDGHLKLVSFANDF